MYIGVLGVVVETVGVGVSLGEGKVEVVGVSGPENTGVNKLIRLYKLILPHPVTGSHPIEAL